MIGAMLRLGREVLKAIGVGFAVLAILMLGTWVFILVVTLVVVAFSDDTLTRRDLEDFAIYLGISLAFVGLISVVVGPISVLADRRKARRLNRRPLERPWVVAASRSGTMHVGEPDRKRLTRLEAGNLVELPASLIGYGTAAPYGVTFEDGGPVYVADPLQGIIVAVPADGESSPVTLGLRGEGALENRPLAVVLEPGGSLVVADGALRRLVRVRGDAVEVVAECSASVRGIAILHDGRIAVSDKFGNRVLALQPDGGFVPIAGTGERGRSEDGRSACSSALAGPTGLAVSPDGRLFIADTSNNRVVAVHKDGKLWTIAGTGDAGFAGDGGAARGARLSAPRGLSFSSGHLLIADTENDRIRVVDASGTIETLLGSPPQENPHNQEAPDSR